MEPIYQFQGSYRFLSNFFIESDGTCVEVEYQREKCERSVDRALFTNLTPGQAKRKGRSVKIRSDWEKVKVEIMTDLIQQKFCDHPALLVRLLATGERELIEGNNWGDRFWGRVQNGQGTGENWLGKILMAVRTEMRSEIGSWTSSP